MGNRRARVILEADRRRLLALLDTHAKAGSISALRSRAIVQVTTDTGLRLSEILALDCGQILEDVRAPKPRISSSFHLTAKQAKGRASTKSKKGYTSSRMVPVPRRAREALLAYLRALRVRGWLKAWKGSPWITSKGRGELAHVPVGPRAVQAAFRAWQIRAGIADPYRWHDLRHTAITRWARASGDVFAVAELAGHSDVRTTQRYVHQEPARLSALSERASDL